MLIMFADSCQMQESICSIFLMAKAMEQRKTGLSRGKPKRTSTACISNRWSGENGEIYRMTTVRRVQRSFRASGTLFHVSLAYTTSKHDDRESMW